MRSVGSTSWTVVCVGIGLLIASLAEAAPVAVEYEITGGNFSSPQSPITGGSVTLNMPVPGSTAPPVATAAATIAGTLQPGGDVFCAGAEGSASRGAGKTAAFTYDFQQQGGGGCAGQFYRRHCELNADSNGNMTGMYSRTWQSGITFYSPYVGTFCSIFSSGTWASFVGNEIMVAPPVPVGPWVAPAATMGVLATAGGLWRRQRRGHSVTKSEI